MNIKGIIKLVVLALLLMVFFHPILSLVLLIKFGGVLFALIVLILIVKLALGKSIIDFFKADQ